MARVGLQRHKKMGDLFATSLVSVVHNKRPLVDTDGLFL